MEGKEFYAYSDAKDKKEVKQGAFQSVANNTDTEVAGYVLDARQGKKIAELNRNFEESFKKDKLADGTFWKKGASIPITGSILNYEKLIIRTGWNASGSSGPSGVNENEHYIGDLTGKRVLFIPCFGHGKLNGTISVEVDPEKPNQIMIVNSTFTTEDATAIRTVFGIKR